MKTREELRQYQHERWLKIKSDPVLLAEYNAKCRKRYHNQCNAAKARYLAKQRERCREYREKNREIINIRQREQSKRWYQSMMADPEKHAKYRQYKREYHRKRKYGNNETVL